MAQSKVDLPQEERQKKNVNYQQINSTSLYKASL